MNGMSLAEVNDISKKGNNIPDCKMKNDEIEARDRAGLKFSGEIIVGNSNRTIAFEPSKEGIEVDDGSFTIPWDWIRLALKQFQSE